MHEKYTASATGFVTSAIASSSPFFLYFAFGHVHTPQYAGAEQAGKSKRGIFGDSMAEVDASVGAVLEAVGDSNTIALLSSDNGAPKSRTRCSGPLDSRRLVRESRSWVGFRMDGYALPQGCGLSCQF